MSEEVVDIPLDVIAKIAGKSDWDTFRVLSRHGMQSAARKKAMAKDALVHPTPEKLAEIDKAYQDHIHHFNRIARRYVCNDLKNRLLVSPNQMLAFVDGGIWYVIEVDEPEIMIDMHGDKPEAAGLRRVSMASSTADAQEWLPIMERYLEFINSEVEGYEAEGNITETQIWRAHRTRYADITNQLRKLTMIGPYRAGDRTESSGGRRRGGMRK